MSWAAKALSAIVRFYQRLMAGRPSPCRFTPSCSSYALEAITEHGATKGSWLAVRRLSRCHPWGGMGYDPVPVRPGPPELRPAELSRADIRQDGRV